MKNVFRSFATTTAVAVITFASFISPVVAFDDEEKKEIETLIRSYLLENPEIIVEVQQALEAKQRELRDANQKRVLSEMQKEIYESPHSVTVGDPNAAITVVEFYDYNCGFCRRAMEDMQKIVSERKDVKFILKEFPVLGEASVEAHRVSLAFSVIMPEKASEFHTRLLGMNGRKDGQIAMKIATELGADLGAMQAKMLDPEIEAAIQSTYQIADGLSISGTPSYIIGDQVVPGAVGYAQLVSVIDGKNH